MSTDTTVRRGEADWSSIDTKIKHQGKEIILPGDPVEMEYDDAIATIERVKQQESQKFDVHEVIPGAPWDALVAAFKACQDIYGVVTSHSIKSWFGEINPTFETIVTGHGPTDKVQVPRGLFRVPGVSEAFYLDYYGTQGAVIYGKVNKKDKVRLVEIANRAREIITEASIYKGKSIRMGVDSGGNLDLSKQPEFLDLTKVTESDMIHTAETELMIRTNVFSPLKNTENCRKHKIPLKRGILLEGRYGTGKSLTARVTAKVANDNNWTFIILDRSQGLRAAIELGRAYQPCVIFAEDIDRAADRSEESVNDLVNLIDGVISKNMEMMTVLTTNFLPKIDQALLRPGRIDAVISIQEPDADAAERLIRHYAAGLLASDADLTSVKSTVAGQIPATIREVVERAKLNMLSEDRDSISVEDLRNSAIGMLRHMELLSPKVESKSAGDRLVECLVDVFAQAVSGGDGAGVEVVNRLTALSTQVAGGNTKLLQAVGQAQSVAAAAGGSAANASEKVDGVSAKVTAIAKDVAAIKKVV